jgi:hypothetical protein
MKQLTKDPDENLAIAERTWGPLDQRALNTLQKLLKKYGFLVCLGHLQFLDGRWYVTHSGLLDIAQRRRCAGIHVQQVRASCEPSMSRWVFKATVYKSPGSKGFVGYGDADPSNVSSLVSGAEMRVAETRAVNRALRKAYGIGLCSVEELGSLRRSAPEPASGEALRSQVGTGNGNGSHNGHGRLRDRLCLLVRQHRLDPAQVKRYAAEFCGTAALRDSSREQVEAFINHLSKWAAEDRAGLVCKLNSFTAVEEVTP